jgi:hypothetical protein
MWVGDFGSTLNLQLCSTFSESIPTSTMDRSHREWRPGASVLAPEISWSHTLRLLLVGIRKRSSFCTTSNNNFGRPKKPYQSFSDARQCSLGVGRIQLPSRCCPCSRRKEHWTFINFIVNTIKCNLHHIYHYFQFWNIAVRNWVHLFESPCTSTH